MFKIQGAKMTFGRGPLNYRKNIIFFKNVDKTTKITFKVHDIKRARLNMFRKLVFYGTIYLVIEEKYV